MDLLLSWKMARSEAISQDQRETFDVTRRSTDCIHHEYQISFFFFSIFSTLSSVVLLLSAWMRVAVKDRIISGLIHRLICISSSTFYWEEESQRAKKNPASLEYILHLSKAKHIASWPHSGMHKLLAVCALRLYLWYVQCLLLHWQLLGCFCYFVQRGENKRLLSHYCEVQ